MSGASTTRHSWLNRIGWLVLLWMAGVAALAAVALLLRELLAAAGLKA
jgi:Protein of unknown function (DUF2474)